jgi:DNA-directed RNA polymerase specialized sigma24 family protein
MRPRRPIMSVPASDDGRELCQGFLRALFTGTINSLPSRERTCVQLHFFAVPNAQEIAAREAAGDPKPAREGLSYREIMKRTGLSYAQVYGAIHRGLLEMRAKLRGHPVVEMWLELSAGD